MPDINRVEVVNKIMWVIFQNKNGKDYFGFRNADFEVCDMTIGILKDPTVLRTSLRGAEPFETYLYYRDEILDSEFETCDLIQRP